MKNISKKTLLIVMMLLITITTFAYSALATSLAITSNVSFRVLADIRVTKIKLQEAKNSATVSYESKYNIDSITSGFILPNTDSSITYKVTVENNGDIDETIYALTNTSNNKGLKAELIDYEVKDVIGLKTGIDFYIKYTTTNPSNEVINVVTKFDYRKIYHIIYDENGGSQVTDQIKYEGEDLILNRINNSLQTPEKTGYTFSGWSIDGSTKAYDAGDTFTIDDDSTPRLTLYALYNLVNYTITYTLNGGTATNPSSYTIETNTFTLNNPSKTGYTFTGWTGSNGTTPQTSVSITKGSTGNKTYTANWIASTYTVTANANGGTIASTTGWTGTGNTSTKSVTYDSAYGNLPEPSKTGIHLKDGVGRIY